MTSLPPLGLCPDRRAVLRLGLLGAGALAAPGVAAQAFGRGFTHGVASGEPGADRVLLWTRYVGAPGDSPRLTYQLAETADFARPLAGGAVRAEAERDHCAKVFATGLEPGRWYHYRFVGPDGALSPVGRTRTLPAGPTPRFRIAVFSCSNLAFGWFNAYRHAADESAGWDLALHLGDYTYEYRRGEYPSAAAALAERTLWPAEETVALADYRLRQATYRADPDLQRLFQLQPWILAWDDHESANDAWKDGADNHQPETEGPWAARKAAAVRAYREWLPVSDEPWAAYQIGDLATLFRLESRLTARDRPFEIGEVVGAAAPGEVAARLAAFRAGAWQDPARTLLGAAQERWLGAGLAASTAAGKRWQVLAQQTVMGSIAMPPSVGETMRPDTPETMRQRIAGGIAASRAGLGWNMDAWDGYPAARERLLGAAQAAGANLVVLAGDSHNAWASELAAAGRAAGVELAGHSVTSPGVERNLAWIEPRRLAADVLAHNPGLKWCETERRGYLALELTPARATGEWRFLETVRARSTRLAATHRMAVARGANRFATA